jgi:hypothetical protein
MILIDLRKGILSIFNSEIKIRLELGASKVARQVPRGDLNSNVFI